MQSHGRLRPLLSAVRMGGRVETRGIVGKLPEHQKIEVEKLADAALGVHDFTVHLAGGQINEFGRKIGEQGLEAQALFKLGERVGIFPVHGLVVSPSRKMFCRPLGNFLQVVSGLMDLNRLR